MRKYNNPRLLNTVVSGTGMTHPVKPHVIISDTVNEFIKGDLMDANAVSELIDQKIGSAEGTTEASVQDIQQRLAEEAAARASADQTLDERITTVSEYIPQAVADSIASVVAGADSNFDTLKEISDYIASDKVGAAQMTIAISDNATAITNEINRATDVESGLSDRIDALEADTSATTAIGAEIARATTKEAELEAAIDTKAPQSTTYTKTEVDALVNGVDVSDQLANYYTKSEIDNAGYITQHQDISGKANSADLATVATSGSYNDLSDKPAIPTVPTNISSFTNDANYQNSDQVDARFTALVGAAPAALDTLEEIADKLSDNDDAVAAIITSIADEATARQTADTTISSTVNDLVTTVTNNYNTLDSKIDTIESTLEDRVSDVEDAIPTKVSELENDATYIPRYSFDANGYDYVEIGGIKWATKNVGASDITDVGLYFQWGDTTGYTASQIGSGDGKKYFDASDYIWIDDPTGYVKTYTKYNYTDNLRTLDVQDDAVVANMGGNWRMPTNSEWQALGEAVNATYTTYDGVYGLLCVDKQDDTKVLFFPSSGYAEKGSIKSSRGVRSWGNELSTLTGVQCVWGLDDTSFGQVGSNYGGSLYRINGIPMRGVLDAQQNLSDVAFSGSYNDLTDKPNITMSDTSNFVTTDTAQNITDTKTFVGDKRIKFKQSNNNDKLGFTLYDTGTTELGYFEWSNTQRDKIGNNPTFILGYYGNAAYQPYIGFAQQNSATGGKLFKFVMPPSPNIVNGFGNGISNTNFYTPLGFKNGSTVVQADNTGIVDMSSLGLPEIWTGTQAEYNAIASPSASTIYFITG